MAKTFSFPYAISRIRRASFIYALIVFIFAVFHLSASAQTSRTAITGNVRYEKILTTDGRLQLNNPVPRPAPGVKVEAIETATEKTLGIAMTDAEGNYRMELTIEQPTAMYVRVLAQTENARVVRPTGNNVYSIRAEDFRLAPGGEHRQDFLAVDRDRSSGPFNIIAAIRRANDMVRAVEPDIDLPNVTIRWSPQYDGSTYFRGTTSEAFIKGDRSSDSDEFDDTVINHEYAHFLASRFSRDDSPGGDHDSNERLDPRLAWGEGWATFFGCVSNNTSRYVDTGATRGGKGGGQTQGTLVAYDLESDEREQVNAGYWNEYTVSSVLWDIYDSANEEGDTIATGFAPVWRAFRDMREDRFTYLINFCDRLVRRQRELGPAMTTLLERSSIAYYPGRNPSVDNPFPIPLNVNQTESGTVRSLGDRRTNLLTSSAFYSFTLSRPREVTVTMNITGSPSRQNADIDLFLLDAEGEMVAHSDETNGVGDSETITRRLEPGYYVIEVRSWAQLANGGRMVFNAGDYDLQLSYGDGGGERRPRRVDKF
jgi:hypothetical protein